MGFFDFFKFAKPTPIQKQNLTSVQKVTAWTQLMDLNEGLNRRDLRKLYLDDEICAATDTRKEACTSTPWLIVGGDEIVNNLVWDTFKTIIPQVLNYSWWAVAYGYSVIQVVWKEEGGRLVPDQIIDQPFESFTFNNDGLPVLFNALNLPLTQDKFFVTIRNKTFNAPAGEALYQRLFSAYYYRLNAWEFWIQYLESWGKPFMHAATDTSDTTTTDFLKTLIGAKRPRGVITNADVKIDVVEGTGSGGNSFKEFEQALSERIQRLILGQTLTSGTGDVGSQALGTVHNEVRDDKRIADCKLLEATVQEIINSFHSLNELPGDVPLFEFQHTKSLNKELAERDNLLLAQGVQHTEKYYEENYDLDPEDFNLVAPIIQTPTFSSNTNPNPQPETVKFAEAKAGSDTTAAQIETEDNALAHAVPIFTEEELQKAIKKAKNKKDLINNLAMLMGKDPDKFTDEMTKANLMGNVAGFDHGSQGD